MLKWAMNGNREMDILEPSCGDGIFLQLIREKQISYNSVTAIEFDEVEYQKALNIELENAHIINDDFHHYCLNTEDRFDLIIGNPPYIRYQYFSKEQQELAEQIFRNSNLKYSKLTNAWVSRCRLKPIAERKKVRLLLCFLQKFYKFLMHNN